MSDGGKGVAGDQRLPYARFFFFFFAICALVIPSYLDIHREIEMIVLPFSAKSHFFCACWAWWEALKITAKTSHTWMSRR